MLPADQKQRIVAVSKVGTELILGNHFGTPKNVYAIDEPDSKGLFYGT